MLESAMRKLSGFKAMQIESPATLTAPAARGRWRRRSGGTGCRRGGGHRRAVALGLFELAQALNTARMLVERLRKDVAATVAIGDEVKFFCSGRICHRLEGGTARIGDRPRRQAV